MKHPSFPPSAVEALPGPKWLRDMRLSSLKKLLKADPPDSNQEVWRYSGIEELELENFNLAAESKQMDEQEFAGLKAETEKIFGELSGLMVVKNGYLAHSWLQPELREKGVEINTAGNLKKDFVKRILSSTPPKPHDIFSLINDTFSPDPLIVFVPREVVCPLPVAVLNIVNGEDLLVCPRLIVHLEEASYLEVLEVFNTGGMEGQTGKTRNRNGQTEKTKKSSLSVSASEFSLAPSAQMGHLRVEDLGESSLQIAAQTSDVGTDANLKSAMVALSGDYVRLRNDSSLSGKGSNGDIFALYFAKGNEKFDFRTFQNHAASHTTSNLLFKGAVDDESRLVYSGLTRVEPDARLIDSNQANHNIKLSADAWVDSVPNLEIENNDVKCAHASSVGPIDKEQRFYLESRGVPSEQAEKLILAGFFEEILQKLPVKAGRNSLRQRLLSYIESDTGNEASNKNSENSENSERSSDA